MRVSVEVLVAIILVMLVIVGVYGATNIVTSSAGNNISNTGNQLGDQLGCIFENKENPSEECKKNSAGMPRDESPIKV